MFDIGFYWLSVENEYGCFWDIFVGVFWYFERVVFIWDSEFDFCVNSIDIFFINDVVNIVNY